MRRGRAIAVSVILVLAVACARPPAVGNGPSPGAETSPVSEDSTEPATTPSVDATAPASSTPSHVPLLQITSATFHAGEVGVAYAPVALTATGGVPPLRWSISVGSLPGGLSSSSGGSVSGTPTAAGTFAFTVRVDDAAGHSATVNRSISVAPGLVLAGICTPTTPCAVEAGCTSVCGTFGKQSGGVGPFTYAFAPGGYVPAGMGLSGLALTGTFPQPVIGVALPPPYKFQVNVSDTLGATGSVVAAFSVFGHISVPNVNAGQQKPGITLIFPMPYSGGQGAAAAAMLNDQLPKGSTWSNDTKNRIIVITVPPQSAGARPILYAATFGLTDQAVCEPSAGQLCTTKGTLTFSV